MHEIPFKLDWGKIFVESYNIEEKVATVIYNFNFDSVELADEIISYCVGHIYWLNKNIYSDSLIKIIFDLRGLSIGADELNAFGTVIKDHLLRLNKSINIDIVFHK